MSRRLNREPLAVLHRPPTRRWSARACCMLHDFLPSLLPPTTSRASDLGVLLLYIGCMLLFGILSVTFLRKLFLVFTTALGGSLLFILGRRRDLCLPRTFAILIVLACQGTDLRPNPPFLFSPEQASTTLCAPILTRRFSTPCAASSGRCRRRWTTTRRLSASTEATTATVRCWCLPAVLPLPVVDSNSNTIHSTFEFFPAPSPTATRSLRPLNFSLLPTPPPFPRVHP